MRLIILSYTIPYHNKHCTDRYKDTREDQVDQERTGGGGQQIPTKYRVQWFAWEEAEVAALDRHRWRRSVAQCVQLDAG